MFDLFNAPSKAHTRRAQTMLHEARLAQLEHEAAAEHHGALARMYAERVMRLESTLHLNAQLDTEHDIAAPLLDVQHNERVPFRVLTQTGSQATG